MIEVVGVRFKKAGKIYYFDPDNQQAQQGDHVIVETVRGTELGEVAIGPRKVSDEEVTQPLKKVVRLATPQDLSQVEENRKRESEAFDVAQKCIEALGLDMKLTAVESAFDKSKLVFFFTSDERVDFRELVKELASKLHTRIELRQVGVRDEAKMLGGLGVCGRCLCCSTWIGDFSPVSIRHAKEQELSMNPGKISGLCGRLKCCLRYEAEAYKDARSRQPKIGTMIPGPSGEARVVSVDLLRERADVQLSEGAKVTVSWEQVKEGRLTEPVVPQKQSEPEELPQPTPPQEQESPPPAAADSPGKGRPRRKSSGRRRQWRKRRPKRAPEKAGS